MAFQTDRQYTQRPRGRKQFSMQFREKKIQLSELANLCSKLFFLCVTSYNDYGFLPCDMVISYTVQNCFKIKEPRIGPGPWQVLNKYVTSLPFSELTMQQFLVLIINCHFQLHWIPELSPFYKFPSFIKVFGGMVYQKSVGMLFDNALNHHFLK